MTFLVYLWPNTQSNHIGSLVGDQCRAYLSFKFIDNTSLNIQNICFQYGTHKYITRYNIAALNVFHAIHVQQVTITSSIFFDLYCSLTVLYQPAGFLMYILPEPGTVIP